MPAVVVYLLFSSSEFTLDTVKAYKSMEAYNYFESDSKPPYTFEQYSATDKNIFDELKRIAPGAVVLRSIPKLDPEDTDSGSEDEQCYTLLRRAQKTSSTRDTFMDDMFVPLKEIERIQKATRQQSRSHEVRPRQRKQCKAPLC
ncbi:uncharacterized protein LOC135398398 [Ornithodoros turicata]|uniref:uncharacterized protein LOC135398398 n=1 Tax=Ornithodoros turicata TaxID=34597 RepID=UPI00313959AF